MRIPSPFFQLRLSGIRELRSCFPANCPCRFQPEEPVTCSLPSRRLHRTQCNGKRPPAHSRRYAKSSSVPKPPGPRGYPLPGAHRGWSDKAASVRWGRIRSHGAAFRQKEQELTGICFRRRLFWGWRIHSWGTFFRFDELQIYNMKKRLSREKTN